MLLKDVGENLKKLFFILPLLVSCVFSKEIKISIDQAISLALENNGLNKISKINLEIA